jgi:hypothetical protein
MSKLKMLLLQQAQRRHRTSLRHHYYSRKHSLYHWGTRDNDMSIMNRSLFDQANRKNDPSDTISHLYGLSAGRVLQVHLED